MEQDNWAMFEEKMKAEGLSQAAIGAFKHNYDQLVKGVTGLVSAASLSKIGHATWHHQLQASCVVFTAPAPECTLGLSVNICLRIFHSNLPEAVNKV
jgi:hypothetical protein